MKLLRRMETINSKLTFVQYGRINAYKHRTDSRLYFIFNERNKFIVRAADRLERRNKRKGGGRREHSSERTNERYRFY